VGVTNVSARCLMCFTSFNTTREAIEEGDAECPDCKSHAICETNE
jgi:predicted Zn-ribbon and HTH transcriptional regulator